MIKYITLLLLSVTVAFSAIGPQMKDFICGCEYCDTVNRGEPLDIADHMMRCHSWRKGLEKTIRMMRQTPKPVVEIKPRVKDDIDKKPVVLDNSTSPYIDYKWREHELYGWSYITTDQELFHRDQWIYIEGFEWVWSVTGNKNLLYSYDYGWLYCTVYRQTRITYWYDKRIWKFTK